MKKAKNELWSEEKNVKKHTSGDGDGRSRGKKWICDANKLES